MEHPVLTIFSTLGMIYHLSITTTYYNRSILSLSFLGVLGVLGYGQTVEHLMAFIPWPKFDTFFTTEKPPICLQSRNTCVKSPCLQEIACNISMSRGCTAAGLFLAIYTHVFASWLLWRQTRHLQTWRRL